MSLETNQLILRRAPVPEVSALAERRLASTSLRGSDDCGGGAQRASRLPCREEALASVNWATTVGVFLCRLTGAIMPLCERGAPRTDSSTLREALLKQELVCKRALSLSYGGGGGEFISRTLQLSG